MSGHYLQEVSTSQAVPQHKQCMYVLKHLDAEGVWPMFSAGIPALEMKDNENT